MDVMLYTNSGFNLYIYYVNAGFQFGNCFKEFLDDKIISSVTHLIQVLIYFRIFNKFNNHKTFKLLNWNIFFQLVIYYLQWMLALFSGYFGKFCVAKWTFLCWCEFIVISSSVCRHSADVPWYFNQSWLHSSCSVFDKAPRRH